MLIAAIVFDLDGVVLDSEEPEFLAWQTIWSEQGRELRLEEWAACIGTGQGPTTFDPYAELVRQTGLQVGEPELRARSRALAAEFMTGRQALPGVARWLDEAAGAGLVVAMASSSPREWVVGHLARLGLTEQFGVIASFDDCGAKKPDPASYLLACRQLGVAPEQAMAVEDSHHGLMAAKAAGLTCVVVPNVMTAHMDFTGADLVLGSLEEAGPLEVIERLGGSPARSELQRH
jgi:putative hydrolase of the HAD superfamily